MKKIVTVIGARPQFIKAGILSKEINKKFQEVIVHTGQHYDQNMSEVFFKEMGIANPNYNLGVGSGTHAIQTATMMVKIEEVLLNEKPDGVLLYGDTNSTLAAAITAAKLNIPIFHVEAGTRTNISDMPEEQNRIVTDHLSSLCFAPTRLSYQNLINEGLKSKAFFSGDVMYDALLFYSKIAEQETHDTYLHKLKSLTNVNKEFGDGYYMATCHRPENTDNKETLQNILIALECLDKPVLFSVHPRIRKYILDVEKKYKNIYFVEPFGYFETLHHLKRAEFLITDSGGLHKEAFLIGTPCVSILRNGWEETLQGNWNEFVRPNTNNILESIKDRKIDFNSVRDGFGNGLSCNQIVCQIKQFFREEK